MSKYRRSASGSPVTLVVILLIVFLLLLSATGFKGLTISDSYRDGVVQKFGEKGKIFQTWEGEMAMEGYKRTEGGGSVWFFSVYDDNLAAAIQEVEPKTPVRLHYRQHRHVWPWQGGTAYEVYRLEALPGEEG